MLCQGESWFWELSDGSRPGVLGNQRSSIQRTPASESLLSAQRDCVLTTLGHQVLGAVALCEEQYDECEVLKTPGSTCSCCGACKKQIESCEPVSRLSDFVTRTCVLVEANIGVRSSVNRRRVRALLSVVMPSFLEMPIAGHWSNCGVWYSARSIADKRRIRSKVLLNFYQFATRTCPGFSNLVVVVQVFDSR